MAGEAGRSPSDPIPRRITAEAAAWLARLHSDDRGGADERAFRAWLSEDTRHAAALERVTAAWDAVGGLRPASAAAPRPTANLARRALVMSGAAGALAACIIGLPRVLHRPVTYSTKIGEQRRILLPDGSSVLLDTATLIRVALDAERRKIELVHGRAHFDVASDPLRPFVVKAGDRLIVALGTAFDVAQAEALTQVVLVRGRVAVEPLTDLDGPADTMAAGDRLLFEQARLVTRDRPDLVRLTSWQQGRAIFDGQSLSEAVAEMNLYSPRPIVVADPGLLNQRVSGVYSTGDTLAFARSLTELFPARIEVTPTRIVLTSGSEKAP